MTQWKSKLLLASLTTGMLAVTAGYASADPRETGVWYDDSGKGAVRLSVCGNNLCGHIYWLKDPLNAEGKPLIDRHNPNEGQRTRLICGLQVIGGLAPMEGGEWDSGWIYDPKEGKSYSVAVALAGPDTLKVTGYLMMKMMGRTLTWKRAPDDLPSCAQNAATAPTPSAPAAKAAAKTPPKPAKTVTGAVHVAPATTKEATTNQATTKDVAKTAPVTKAAAKTPSKPAKPVAKTPARVPVEAAAGSAEREVLPWAEK
ncbi:MAG TPA: DUF2147 domain-containing protein [Hyphomicrobium sp.]|nr:DUF2147 domain-containing protein [Hyphomicrobium sp.]